MRILALSDIHGSFTRAREIIAKESSAGLVVLGGDLTARGAPDDALTLVNDLRRGGTPLLAVAGNMDSPGVDRVLSMEGLSIDGRGVIVEEVGFAGVSAAPLSPLHTPYEITEEEISRRIEAGWRQIAPARTRILVSHAPPHNTGADRTFMGRHVGSISVRRFIDTHHPSLVICGHIHEARSQERLGSTLVVNSGPAREGYYALIDLSHEDVSVMLRQLPGS